MTTRRFGWSFSVLLLAACDHNGAAPAAPPADPCPTAWLDTPTVDAPIAVPPGNPRVVLHAAATGTQNYTCSPGADGGAPAWSFIGPEATLSDCKGATLGKHFATDAGAPEWQLADGTYVVAHKVAASPKTGAVPWLLLAADGHGASGPLTTARFVQRVNTTGGVAPDAPCDASSLGAGRTVKKIPYTADYYFYAP